MNSIRRYIQNGQKDDVTQHIISKDDFDKAISKIPPSESDDFSQGSVTRFRDKRRENGKKQKKDYIA